MVSKLDLSNDLNGLEIAVIGISGRFPGAKDLDAFWQNLRDGVESISFFSDEELLSSGLDSTLLKDPNYVKAKPIISDIESFDAEFFGISPKEAELIDPQHRLFLEFAWSALENAGYNPETYQSAIGVYAGTDTNTYLINNICPNFGGIPDLQTLISNATDYLSTRVSYKLNLRGPSVTVQTACSTSLVAVHLACQSLLNGECEMFLAGGISLSVPEKAGYIYQAGGVYSPDGHCRAFDAEARGTIFGEGVGIVVLKRLEDAIADGDCIHAIIKGSAINNDGSVKAGYTAPSPDGQSAVISEAQTLARIDPETVTYIEAHGTGTALGDPLEIVALTEVFRQSTVKKGYCALGSVKTNVGHLSTAAGVAGLIKTILSLSHQLIPPSLHFETPNPEIDFANSPFYVNTKLSEWKTNGSPRRAGVSSFGIGGTNAHVVLEEAPVVEPSSPLRSRQLLLLSAKTNSALETATTNLLNHIKVHPELNLADVAYTLQVGRQAFKYRRAVVCQNLSDAVSALQDPQRVLTSFSEPSDREVVFMFPGQGAQYVNMARELYHSEPTFAQQVDLCCQLLEPDLEIDLRQILYPIDPTAVELETAARQLEQTAITQPALFVLEYALAKLWMSWGVHPVAMIGHSIGEYTAACLAGVFSLEAALDLVAERGKLMQQLPPGSMLAVDCSELKVQPYLGKELSVAVINGSRSCVVSGSTLAVEALENQLLSQGIDSRRLHTSHAFHSPMMEPMIETFRQRVALLSLKPPQIPYISNVTGTWIRSEEATSPAYWANHIRQTVRFEPGLQELFKKPKQVLLEVGPGHTLSKLAQQHHQKQPEQVVLSSVRHPKEQQSDLEFLFKTLGQLWLFGVQIDWSGFSAQEKRYRLPLPTYPFERQRHWLEPCKNKRDFRLNHEKLAQKLDLKDWFYIPSWKQTALPEAFEPSIALVQKQIWLVFIDGCGIGCQMVERLKNADRDVIVVEIGDQFSQLSEGKYLINPGNRNDYGFLLKALNDSNKIPQRIAHLWNITPSQHISSRLDCLEKAQALGFYSLLFLAQALGEQNITNITDSLQIGVVSNNVQELLGEEELCPEKATLLGACKVISQEYSTITCRSIDITLSPADTRQRQQLIDRLLAEIATETADQVIAYRGKHRWVQDFEPLPMTDQISRNIRLREGGVYVVTGGLGKLGLIVSEYLAKTVRAKLVLIARSGLPPKAEWSKWLSRDDEQNPLRNKIEKVLALEELGAEVIAIAADVSNLEQMQATIEQVKDRFGKIDGVFHLAGVAGASFIQGISPETASKVFEPKVKGTLVLDYVLKDTQLDFLLLFSSITSIVGGLGQADYCAANTFLDAFAHYNLVRGKTFTVSVNWDGWQENNLQDELISSYGSGIVAEFKKFREKYSITELEGREALDYVLSRTVPQVVVSTQNLHYQIEHIHDRLNNLLQQAHLPPSTPQRPNLRTAYVPPRDDVERKLTSIYQELLGGELIGVNDNFFDLGGNSLIGIQLISRLKQELAIEISINHLFQFPSIAELALVVAKIIIEELEKLTEEEVGELVSDIPNSERVSKSRGKG
jgi:acyl transferase domain-containing protein/acyl carrier protein